MYSGDFIANGETVYVMSAVIRCGKECEIEQNSEISIRSTWQT